MHRQLELVGDGHQDAAARGAVELGHHQAGDAGGLAEDLDLVERVLPDGGVEHQEHRMRRGRLDLAHDAHDLFQFAHQLGAVLQTAGGVDQHHVDVLRLGGGDGVEGEAGRVGALLARHHRSAGALGPDLELLDGGGAERVAGHQHYAFALATELGGELADGGGFAGAVDPAHQDDEGPRGDLQRLGHRRHHLLDLASEHVAHFIGRNALLEAAAAEHRGDADGEVRPEVGADQFVFQVFQRVGVELALGHQIGNRRAELRRGALEPAAQALPPTLALCAVVHSHFSSPPPGGGRQKAASSRRLIKRTPMRRIGYGA